MNLQQKCKSRKLEKLGKIKDRYNLDSHHFSEINGLLSRSQCQVQL